MYAIHFKVGQTHAAVFVRTRDFAFGAACSAMPRACVFRLSILQDREVAAVVLEAVADAGLSWFEGAIHTCIWPPRAPQQEASKGVDYVYHDLWKFSFPRRSKRGPRELVLLSLPKIDRALLCKRLGRLQFTSS